MARFNNRSAPYAPNQGLSMCAAMDRQRTLKERRAMRHTPVEFNGIQYLGWETMPRAIRELFLDGAGAVRIVRVLH